MEALKASGDWGERVKGGGEGEGGEKPSGRNEKREKKLAPAAGESIVPS